MEILGQFGVADDQNDNVEQRLYVQHRFNRGLNRASYRVQRKMSLKAAVSEFLELCDFLFAVGDLFSR